MSLTSLLTLLVRRHCKTAEAPPKSPTKVAQDRCPVWMGGGGISPHQLSGAGPTLHPGLTNGSAGLDVGWAGGQNWQSRRASLRSVPGPFKQPVSGVLTWESLNIHHCTSHIMWHLKYFAFSNFCILIQMEQRNSMTGFPSSWIPCVSGNGWIPWFVSLLWIPFGVTWDKIKRNDLGCKSCTCLLGTKYHWTEQNFLGFCYISCGIAKNSWMQSMLALGNFPCQHISGYQILRSNIILCL